jgi:hypothetical protein
VKLLVLCRSDQGDGGWSLHSPGTTDEEIANGENLLISGVAKWDDELDGWDRPNNADYRRAKRAISERGKR